MEVTLATEPWEFEQVHSLNYETFVEEIPQHQENENKALVDKFHDKNQYIIVIQNKEVLGMMSINDQRPFSLDHKLPDLEKYLPGFKRAFEVRLLAVKKEYRGKPVFLKLFSKLKDILDSNPVDGGLISATPVQIKLYEKIGFKAFGPLVGTEKAPYQPMWITWDSFCEYVKTIEPKLKATLS